MRGLVLLIAAAMGFGQDALSLASISEKQARQTIGSMRVQGRVGGTFDFRGTNTDRSINYKLRATWITPAVVAAAARLLMTSKGFTEAKAKEVVQAFAASKTWLVLVELDPREGSGVIPKDWLARFGVPGDETLKVVGHQAPSDGVWQNLLSAFPRDYSYDVFLMEFPRTLENGKSVLQPINSD